MKRKDVIMQLLDDVHDIVGADVNVRTAGGDQDANPPEVILDYSETRLPNAAGHKPTAGYTTREKNLTVETDERLVIHEWQDTSYTELVVEEDATLVIRGTLRVGDVTNNGNIDTTNDGRLVIETGYTADDVKDERLYHMYWSVDADFRLRYYSEAARDTMATAVQSAFVPYESNAKLFDEDTRQWSVGSSQSRGNAVVEPDWYEEGVLVQFEYVNEVSKEADVYERVGLRDVTIKDIE